VNDFVRIFEEMGIDRSILPILMRANRSTIHKYLEGAVNVPATAQTLLMLLQLIQKRDHELFKEWMVLSDFTIPPEVYLEQPDYWKGWKFTEHKVNNRVLQYLKDNPSANDG
jgi:hypothetical protein